MPKQKTHKGLSKRVKVTGKGKVKYRRCNGSHLMSGKSAQRRRRIGSAAVLGSTLEKTFRRGLGK